MGVQLPPTPPVDPANEEFVLFIRAVKFPQWYPLSVVKGGSAANVLVKAMENDFGKKLYGKTLIRNIGRVRGLSRPALCARAGQGDGEWVRQEAVRQDAHTQHRPGARVPCATFWP